MAFVGSLLGPADRRGGEGRKEEGVPLKFVASDSVQQTNATNWQRKRRTSRRKRRGREEERDAS